MTNQFSCTSGYTHNISFVSWYLLYDHRGATLHGDEVSAEFIPEYSTALHVLNGGGPVCTGSELDLLDCISELSERSACIYHNSNSIAYRLLLFYYIGLIVFNN